MSGHDCPECGESFPSSSCALGGSIGHDCTYKIREQRLVTADRADLVAVLVAYADGDYDQGECEGITDAIGAVYDVTAKVITDGCRYCSHSYGDHDDGGCTLPMTRTEKIMERETSGVTPYPLPPGDSWTCSCTFPAHCVPR